MNLLLIFFTVCVVTIQTASISETTGKSLDEWDFESSAIELTDAQWHEFKLTYKKEYKDKTEELYRKKIFIQNSIKIAENNLLLAKGLVFTPMGVNRFTDLPFEEFFNTYSNCLREPEFNETHDFVTFIPPAHVTLPDEVDWRKDGAVTPVKDQGSCGSCYSFAATGTVEGQHFRKDEKLVSLSEQNIIDCADSSDYGDYGCHGGSRPGSLKFIKDNKGIDTEESYPYEDTQDECRYDPANKGATISQVVLTKRGSEEDLKAAVATYGPVAVGINVQPSFQNFKPSKTNVNEVYYEPDCDPNGLNHAVLLVGYGTDPEDAHPDYWIVKNSWAEGWGDKGYIKMARNEKNHCGIATSPVYPLI